jgi:hypothetical protein
MSNDITILFSDGSDEAALRWLDATFGRTNDSQYRDRRMAWYGLHLLGWLIGLAVISPLLTHLPLIATKIAPIRRWAGLIAAPLAATAGLVLLSQRFELQNLGGVQVGGAVGVWFLVAGLTWLGVLARLPRPTLRAIGLGVVLFVILWVAFGAMAQVVWLQWWLIPIRLKVWLPVAHSFAEPKAPPVSLGFWQQESCKRILGSANAFSSGTERRFDWWLRVDAQLLTSIGLYVSALAALAATDGNIVFGGRSVKPSMGLRDRLCFILRLVIGSRFSPVCLTCVLSNSPLGIRYSCSDLVTVRKLFPCPNAVFNCTYCSFVPPTGLSLSPAFHRYE